MKIVTPYFIHGNGLQPIFSSKKKWGVDCGSCGSYFMAKSPISETISIRCPLCDAINRFSYSQFLRSYEIAETLIGEEQ